MVAVKLHAVTVADSQLRFCLLDEEGNFLITNNVHKAGCQPLFLGCDVLTGTSDWAKNRCRVHARFAKQGLATKLTFSGCRIEGLPKGDEAYFYNVHGLFKVAFEYQAVSFQRHCLQHLTDIWMRTCKGDELPALDATYKVSQKNLVFVNPASPHRSVEVESTSDPCSPETTDTADNAPQAMVPAGSLSSMQSESLLTTQQQETDAALCQSIAVVSEKLSCATQMDIPLTSQQQETNSALCQSSVVVSEKLPNATQMDISLTVKNQLQEETNAALCQSSMVGSEKLSCATQTDISLTPQQQNGVVSFLCRSCSHRAKVLKKRQAVLPPGEPVCKLRKVTRSAKNKSICIRARLDEMMTANDTSRLDGSNATKVAENGKLNKRSIAECVRHDTSRQECPTWRADVHKHEELNERVIAEDAGCSRRQECGKQRTSVWKAVSVDREIGVEVAGDTKHRELQKGVTDPCQLSALVAPMSTQSTQTDHSWPTGQQADFVLRVCKSCNQKAKVLRKRHTVFPPNNPAAFASWEQTQFMTDSVDGMIGMDDICEAGEQDCQFISEIRVSVNPEPSSHLTELESERGQEENDLQCVPSVSAKLRSGAGNMSYKQTKQTCSTRGDWAADQVTTENFVEEDMQGLKSTADSQPDAASAIVITVQHLDRAVANLEGDVATASGGEVAVDLNSYIPKWVEEASSIKTLLNPVSHRGSLQTSAEIGGAEPACDCETHQQLRNQWDFVLAGLDLLLCSAELVKSSSAASFLSELLLMLCTSVKNSASFHPTQEAWPDHSPLKLSVLTSLGRWLGNAFHRFEPAISQRVTKFKESHIDNISDLPCATEVIGELFPQCMLVLASSWIGLTDIQSAESAEKDHSYEGQRSSAVQHNSNLYPVLQLVLELLNNSLVSGIAHVVYCKLRHAT